MVPARGVVPHLHANFSKSGARSNHVDAGLNESVAKHAR